jgi:Mrp family chromosome partitioning ATPase/capsular polysaccharide biosynthesis protein
MKVAVRRFQGKTLSTMRDDAHPDTINAAATDYSPEGLAPVGRATSQPKLHFSVDWCLRAVSRYWPTLITAVVAALLPAFFYLSIAKPRYSAVGEVIFDVREPKVTTSNPIIQSLNLDNYAIDSQVEIMRSYGVVSAAIARLEQDKGKLANGDDATWETLFPVVGPQTAEERQRIMTMVTQERFNTFLQGLFVERKGVSYVMQVSYIHTDPTTAARAVNTIMASYLSTQRRVKAETVQKAYEWLVMRTEELRQKLVEAELRLQKFKTEDAVIDAKVMNTIYSSFLARTKETQSQEMLQTPDARIVSVAVPPTRPVAPKRGLVLAFSLAAGLSAGLALIFLQALKEPGVNDLTDIPRLTQLQPLAALPWLDGASDETPDYGPFSLGAHVLQERSDHYTQALYGLVQEIEDRKPVGGAAIVAIVSARDGDGKTTTALNLARSGATTGLKTLLIDADLRTAASTRAVFDTFPKLSLEDWALEHASRASCCIPDPLSTLQVCPSPTTNTPATQIKAVFNSPNFPMMIDDMRRTYDLVIIDTPAFFEQPDTRAILRHVDMAMVIAKLGHTRKDELAAVVSFCAHRLADRIGIVATNDRSSSNVTSAPYADQVPVTYFFRILQSRRRPENANG